MWGEAEETSTSSHSLPHLLVFHVAEDAKDHDRDYKRRRK